MLTVYFKLIITIHCLCAYAMNCILDIAIAVAYISH